MLFVFYFRPKYLIVPFQSFNIFLIFEDNFSYKF